MSPEEKTALLQAVANLESRVSVLEDKANTPQPTTEPTPPVDNDHVADGCEKFTGETIGANQVEAQQEGATPNPPQDEQKEETAA